MQTERYGSGRKGLDAGGLGLALGATAALLFGLTLTAPHFVKVPETILEGINIPLEVPKPPPPEPKPEPAVRSHQPTSAPPPDRVDVSTPPVPGPPIGINATDTETPPNPGPLVGIGEGGATGTIPQPVRVPIEVAAKLDQRYADTFQPDYPAGERDAAREGRVVVRVLIGADGRVKNVEQVSAPSTALFEATRRRALAKWRFVPATRDGVPYESWQRIGVQFKLDTE